MQAAEVSASMAVKGLMDPSSSPNVKVHMATVNVKLRIKGQASTTNQVKQKCMLVDVGKNEQGFTNPNVKRKKAIRAVKSQ